MKLFSWFRRRPSVSVRPANFALESLEFRDLDDRLVALCDLAKDRGLVFICIVADTSSPYIPCGIAVAASNDEERMRVLAILTSRQVSDNIRAAQWVVQ